MDDSAFAFANPNRQLPVVLGDLHTWATTEYGVNAHPFEIKCASAAFSSLS